MRALALLLLVVVSLLLVLRFFPGDEAKGAGPVDGDPSSQFVAVGEGASSDPSDVSEGAQDSQQASPGQGTPGQGASAPAGPIGGEPSTGGSTGRQASADEILVAAALVHRGPAGARREMQVRRAGLDDARSLLTEAFCLALEGNFDQARDAFGQVGAGELSATEQRLRDLVLGVGGSGAVAAEASTGSTTSEPLANAVRHVLLRRAASDARATRQHAAAARIWGSLIEDELRADWTPDRGLLGELSEELAKDQAQYRWSPRGAWPGVEMTVQGGDSLTAIRVRFLEQRGHGVICTGLIARANGVHPDRIQPGDLLRVPTDPVSVWVDLASRWAVYYHADEMVAAWPVGIGRPGEETITGDFVAGPKIVDPPWMRIGHDPVPFGDPANPLGTRWIDWFQDGVKTHYAFHGTWDPESIGGAVSDGCVRMLNKDVEELFEILPVGAPIHVRASLAQG